MILYILVRVSKLYLRLQALADELNIVAGVGTADIFDIDEKCLKNVPFVNYKCSERLDPSITMPNCKSLVAIGIPYNVIYRKKQDDILRGNMSSGAVGEDYHIKAIRYLNIIKEKILCDYNAMAFADTGPLIDREVAIRCHLGYRGRHGNIINEKIGSMFFIGYAITDVPYNIWNCEDIEITGDCGDCSRCVKACPTGAINSDGFDYKKCISYITQKPGVLSDEEAVSIGIQIYGCDMCQRACIKNKFLYNEDDYAYPDIEELINISNKDFKRIYGTTAAGWRGKKILQRNAIIALGNMGDTRALPILEKLKNDIRDDIRKTALWAIDAIRKG